MSGTAITVGGGGGKVSGKKFVPGSRGQLLYLVRADVAHALAEKDGQLMPLIADSLGRIYVKDSQIALVVEALSQLGLTNSLLQALTEGILVKNTVKVQTRVVSCPSTPIEISNVVTGAHTANHTMGNISVVDVPPSGIIYSATLWDLDDEGLQIDLEIFKHQIPRIGPKVAWSPTDATMLKFVTELAFVNFDDHDNSRTSELENIGKAYSAPEGKFHIQAIARGLSNIDQPPRFQLQILSDDPDWEER